MIVQSNIYVLFFYYSFGYDLLIEQFMQLQHLLLFWI